MSQPTDDHWACACLKRGPGGELLAIKLHPPTAKKCGVCGRVPLIEAERVTTSVAKKCRDCGRHFDKPSCPFCAAIRGRSNG